MLVLARILLSVLLVTLNSISAVRFVAMGGTLAFGIYIAVKQPYITKDKQHPRRLQRTGIIHNPRPIRVLSHLFISPNPTSPFSSVLPDLILSMLFLVILANTFLIFKHVHDKKQLYLAK